ncbi:hypothetical protein [Paenibacillus sp. Soil522]|uniref:hypothetical protein n=1 Tax=Paenibacillus sp. Soil522 TaxID=1736388 RepID=UPI001F3ABF9D|nr:hypothetical protein [Paenibacillus sp. Soil522]
MDSVFRIEGKRLIRRYDAEQLWVEPWGAISLRVRATELDAMQDEDWALLPQEAYNAQISVIGQTASIQNGNIRAEISAGGMLTRRISRWQTERSLLSRVDHPLVRICHI